MGQNNSSNLIGSRSAPTTPRDRAKTPPPRRPSSPPQIPKVPNYAVPENRVLPLGAPELPNKRQLLRPVSQEYSKFHPEFADIFAHHDDEGLGEERGEGEGKENILSSPISIPASGDKVTSGSLSNGDFKTSRYSHVNGDLSKKPNNIELSRSQSLQEKPANGHLLNGHISTNPKGSDVIDRDHGVYRTNSLDRATTSGAPKGRGHKRYPSAGRSMEVSVIPEDPREHLYSHWRQDPYSNPTPTSTSLPVHSSFQLDYKESVTYAQLTEHRRQQRMADLENRTGRKLADLNADLQSKSTLPVSPFDRNHYTPSQPSASSTTGSSDTGVSKSKKRRAPPPPGAKQPRDNSPGRLSLDTEPPADYDLDDNSPRLDTSLPWKPNLSRTSSSASASSAMSRTSKGPAPTPPPPPAPPLAPKLTAPSPESLQHKLGALSAGTYPSSGSLPSKSASPLSASSARLIAQAKAELEALKKLDAILKEKESARSKEEHTERDDDGSPDTVLDKNTMEDNKDTEQVPLEKVDSSDSKTDVETVGALEQSSDGTASPMSLSSADTNTNANKSEAEKSDSLNSPRKLSTLLQYDIKLAAEARGAKGQVKPKTPAPRDKPKDAAELFREELAKAATAREERARTGDPDQKSADGEANKVSRTGSSDNLVFQSDLVKVKRRGPVKEAASVTSEPTDSKPPPPPISPKPTTEASVTKSMMQSSKSESDLVHPGGGKTKKSSDASLVRQRIPDDDPVRRVASHSGILDLSDDDELTPAPASHKKSNSLHQFPEDWKPEDDLESDDDMRDDLTYSRNSTALESSDGFKSSIIPSKVGDLQSAKRKSSKSSRRESGSSTDEKGKFGSIRKFQKSVHKSVKNAFGSISKASGKILRRNRSLDVEPAVEGQKYRVADEDDSRPKSILMNGHENLDRQLSQEESAEESDEEQEDASPQDKGRRMQRAGVAYIGRKGQIVVLPEFDTVNVDEQGHVIDDGEDEGRAPRIFRKKKKKFTYESTVRRVEKERAAEHLAGEVRDKERVMEAERRQQLDMEQQFQRLRDMETQDRLHRLQTAQLQQQMSLLQQQQQQLSSLQMMQGGGLTSQRYTLPQLSGPAGGLYTTSGGMAHLPPVNMSSYSVQQPAFLPPVTTTAVTSVGGYDVNSLSNYMRVMGVQPPATQQQWAYLLSSINQPQPNALLTTKALVPASSAGPDLSHLFASKAPLTDPSILLAQKSSLMTLLNASTAQGVSSPDTLLTPGAVSLADQVTLPPQQDAPSARSAAGAGKRRERKNPVYFSSDDEEELARKARESAAQQPSTSSAASRPVIRQGSKDKRRPHSTNIPVARASVYRDVTSRQEAGVTRVHVPDYRHDDVYQANDVTRSDDDESDFSEEEEEVRNDLRNGGDSSVTRGRSAGERVAAEDGGFRTVEFQHASLPSPPPSSSSSHSPSRASASILPSRVYGPLGYKPVNFTPASPRAAITTNSSTDR